MSQISRWCALGILLPGLLACLAPSASAQGLGDLFRGLGGQSGGNNRSGNQPGNWFQRTPRYGEDGELRGYDTTPNIPNIINDAARAIDNQQRRDRDYNYNGNNYPNNGRPYYPRNTAPRQPAPQPARNVVKTVAKKPPANTFRTFQGQKMSAETDAKQANEASKAGGKLDAAVSDEVTKLDAANPGMKAAYIDAVTSGDPAKYAAFEAMFGGKLSPGAQASLDLRIDLLNYEKDLNAGILTDAGKDQRLQALQTKAAGIGGPLGLSVNNNLAEMNNFNELGKLADLAEGTDNPLGTMAQGIESAGYPPSMLAEMSGLPVLAGDPLTDASAGETLIMLSNPTAETVNYNLGPHPYTMQPGLRQGLAAGYVITFDAGVGGVVRKYTLSQGSYNFVQGDAGWDLNKVKIQVTLDNSQYDGPFHYLLDGKNEVLGAGEVAELTSDAPITLEFDRGDGGQPARKVLTQGAYLVGVDAKTQRFDLFDAATQPPMPEAAVAVAGGGSSSSSSGAKRPSASTEQEKQQRIAELLERLKGG